LNQGGNRIGVFGTGSNIDTGAQVGGYFTLKTTNEAAPTFTSAALIADNDDQTSPILLLRDNGTVTVTVADSGVTTFNDNSSSTADFTIEGDAEPTLFFVDVSADDVIINDGGTAAGTFRVEGDTQANLLFTDGTNDRVGVATGSPLSRFDVDGSIAWDITATSTTITLDITHGTIICDATGGDVTLDLPTAASAARRVYNVKKIDATANDCKIDPSGAETIDDAASRSIVTQYENVQFQSDGTEWWIL
jgi:hypothetical protein